MRILYPPKRCRGGYPLRARKKLAAIAAWRNEEHGPWQLHEKQEKHTNAFHYLGDTDVVFLEWI